ncbi:mRNA export factor GLE1-like isoform X2 [Carassius carassius]|uniref:mRNA export factor GLE1-like isoform X2 n=1 Tax=Carassius carassius TaxID=217509 RepID=UPI0028695EEF|nr:mRNA export factor GLE1-like isoform X2 [Carassius carassius]
MHSENLRWETLGALKNSPKGKLKYSPDWLEMGEDVLAGCMEMSSLSPLSGQILKRLSPRPRIKTCSLTSCVRDTSPGLSEDFLVCASIPISPRQISSPTSSSPVSIHAEEEEQKKAEEIKAAPAASVSSPPVISVLSPRATQMAGCILMCEHKHKAKAKAELSLRQEQQERLVASVSNCESEQLKRYEEFMEPKQRQEYQSMRDMMEKETQESLGRQEKLREEHRHRMKILNLRLREAELERQREAELVRQRQVEGRERHRAINSIQEEVLQLNQLLQPRPSTHTDSALDHTPYITRGNQLCSQVSEVVPASADGQFPSVEDLTVAERVLQEMRSLVRNLQDEVAQAAERKRKEQEEEEEKKKRHDEPKAQQAEQKKNAAQSAKEKTRKQGLQTGADDNTLKWYNALQDSASRCTQAFDELSRAKDTQTKKLKMELQKAATTPVSQIPNISGAPLKEAFEKIDKLLSGRPVTSAGKTVSTSQHHQGLEFVSYKLAEKFVKQGEEEVASNHSAAFPIAAVASGIWELHPAIGELVLAHLHRKCPYAVPHYPPMERGTSVEDYQKILGYRVEDSKVEGQDSFLKRMSGMIHLYAAIIQMKWPYTSKQGLHPHGLNHGWRWLAQILNMEPLADITATILFDFLEVCGNALMRQYRGQFWKLILLIIEEYFPRIEAVTSTGQMGSVTRLKQFLETSLRTKQIPAPRSELGSAFFKS